MDFGTIQKLESIEEEIRQLHYDPPFFRNSDRYEEKKELLRGFWDHHVRQVIDFSKEMAVKYKADEEIAWLGAIVHDIAFLEGKEPHDELGAEMTKKYLLEKGYSNLVAERVADIVLKHRCKKFQPESLEEKIVVTADAMAHFLPAYYLGIAIVAKEEYPGIINGSYEKLERDYEGKIFFEDEKKMLRDRMSDFRKWFAYGEKK